MSRVLFILFTFISVPVVAQELPKKSATEIEVLRKETIDLRATLISKEIRISELEEELSQLRKNWTQLATRIVVLEREGLSKSVADRLGVTQVDWSTLEPIKESTKSVP